MDTMKVRDVMTNLVVTLRPGDTIPQAAQKLLSNRISGAPVVMEGKLQGVVTEADLVAAWASPVRAESATAVSDPLIYLLRGRLPTHQHKETVGDVMTTDVVVIGPDASIWEAARSIDRHGVRRLPVVDETGCVVGIIARSDLVRAMVRSDDDLEASIREAIEILGEENFSDLRVVVDGGVAYVGGTADRRSTKQLAVKLAREVPGLLEVRDDLGWRWDDSGVHLSTGTEGLGKDPKAVGPLVEPTR